MRPMLERIDFTVRHLASIVGDLDELQQNKDWRVVSSMDKDQKNYSAESLQTAKRQMHNFLYLSSHTI